MAKIVKLANAKEHLSRRKAGPAAECDHKYVTVYRATRTVYCATCNLSLDPFDVLVDIVKGYVPAAPPGPRHDDERRLANEEERRKKKPGDDEPAGAG
ncbi:MAG: hypothetical protein OEV91_00470 [Desulfobulbaceae bacterium]|nr:hypothetical protein [Desulfobulbaceae bacterium]